MLFAQAAFGLYIQRLLVYTFRGFWSIDSEAFGLYIQRAVNGQGTLDASRLPIVDAGRFVVSYPIPIAYKVNHLALWAAPHRRLHTYTATSAFPQRHAGTCTHTDTHKETHILAKTLTETHTRKLTKERRPMILGAVLTPPGSFK